MTDHDRFAAHETLNRYWFNYDEGRLDVLRELLTDDCHLSSRTELGNHPFEEFIRSDTHGKDAALAWTGDHRRNSPYPLRHNATNIHVVAERDGEIDLESYLFVTQIVDRTPSALSSGIVHVTMVRTDEGYKIKRKDVVLDSIQSAPFHTVAHVAEREKNW